MFRSSYRTALLLIGLTSLAACDKKDSFTAPATGYINPEPARQSVRGILRRAMDVPDTTTAWELELADGSMLHLIGGPDNDVYAALENQAVFVIGQPSEAGLVVESCVVDTQILVEYNRRPSARR